MNTILLPQDDTKTIKYVNYDRNSIDQKQLRATQSKYEQDISKTKRGNHMSKLSPKAEFHSKTQVRKVVLIEQLQSVDNQKQINNNQSIPKKSHHKKGKSMNLQQLELSEKSDKQPHAVQIQNVRDKGKVTINMNFINEFRSRNSSSENKEYAHSKRYTANKKNSKNSPLILKKKKAKPNYESEIKQVKQEIKSILEATFKKKGQSKSSSKVNKTPISANSLQLFKSAAKKQQNNIDRKYKSTQRDKQSLSRNTNDLKNISYTLPITAKMVSLYSNTTSVYNSTQQLQKYDQIHQYVIPTEQSIEEIPEIRKYQSLASRKKNSQSPNNIRKIRLAQQWPQNGDDQVQSTTQNIINKYLQILKNTQYFSNQIHSNQSSQIDQQSSQNNQQQILYRQKIQLQPLRIQYSDGSQPKFQISSVLLCESDGIKSQQNEINKLNQIMQMIRSQELNYKLNTQQKTLAIMIRIKQLIGQPNESRQLELQIKNLQKIDNKQKDKVHNQLYSSISSQENTEDALNLEMLDRALQQRYKSLVEKKDRELSLLQDLSDQDKAQVQRQKILKWMNSQIKQVVQTRNQLWKGFNLAKKLLQDQEILGKGGSSTKKRQMMRCLSDKYLNHSPKNKKARKKQKQQSLQRGRVTKLTDINKQQKSSVLKPEININIPNQFIDSQESLPEYSEQNLLNSHSKPLQIVKTQNEQNSNNKQQPQKFKQQQCYKQQPKQNDQNKDLFQAINLDRNPSQTNSVLETSCGLNLQKIVCEIQCEDSYNQDELEQLANKNQQQKLQQSIQTTYNLSQEDKEDIYQFIFLDLCIQLTEEYQIDSPVMRRIFAFTKKVKDQSKKNKGFKTNTTAIKDYLFKLISFIKAQPSFLEDVHKNLDKPIGPTALDILKYMHVQNQQSPDEQTQQTVFIMDINIFQEFEKVFLQTLEFEKYYEDQEKERKRRMFLKNAMHIHNKSIFDCLNETLDKQRPFGSWGQPFSWKKTAKFYHSRDNSTKNNIILKCAQKTVECGAYVCGFMIDKQDCNFKDNTNVTQSYIQSIRDDRLSRMLASDLQEGQQKMLFIDDEQTQILVQVSHSIVQTLLLESIEQISFTL